MYEVETGAVVPVLKFHKDKEPEQSPMFHQVQTKQTRIPMMWVSSSMPIASEKYLMGLLNVLVPEIIYL